VAKRLLIEEIMSKDEFRKIAGGMEEKQ